MFASGTDARLDEKTLGQFRPPLRQSLVVDPWPSPVGIASEQEMRIGFEGKIFLELFGDRL